MEEILKNMLPHGIGVVAAIIIVRYFLQSQRHESAENRVERASRDKLFVDAMAARDRLFTDTISGIHKENLEARTVTRESTNANTGATNVLSKEVNTLSKEVSANTATTGRVAEKLAELIAVGK